MFNKNRCYDKSMNYSSETTFNFNEGNGSAFSNMNAFPEAMPEMAPMMNPCCEMPPVYECPQERVCHREIVHNVQHICPINTRIINHHIYRHTYAPCYSSCEENTCCNVYEGSCCNF